MDEEIDEWFKLEQEKLEKQFFKETKAAIDAGEDYSMSKAHFEHKFKKLMHNYEQKYYHSWSFEKRKKLLMKPVELINKGMHELVVAFRE